MQIFRYHVDLCVQVFFVIQRSRTKYLERFKSELGLSISVCWVFSVYQVSKLGQEKNMSEIIDCLKLLK